MLILTTGEVEATVAHEDKDLMATYNPCHYECNSKRNATQGGKNVVTMIKSFPRQLKLCFVVMCRIWGGVVFVLLDHRRRKLRLLSVQSLTEVGHRSGIGLISYIHSFHHTIRELRSGGL